MAIGIDQCWICRKGSEQEPFLFDTEWDTVVHQSCIKETLTKEPAHDEVRFMLYLLSEDPDYEKIKASVEAAVAEEYRRMADFEATMFEDKELLNEEHDDDIGF